MLGLQSILVDASCYRLFTPYVNRFELLRPVTQMRVAHAAPRVGAVAATVPGPALTEWTEGLAPVFALVLAFAVAWPSRALANT